MFAEKLRAFHIHLASILINDRPFAVYFREIKLSVKSRAEIITAEIIVEHFFAVYSKI